MKLLWRGLLQGDGFSQYILAERISGFLYPQYKFSEYGRFFLEDSQFQSWFMRYVGIDNYHSLDRKFNLSQLLKLIGSVQGDTVECGVYRGASSHLICQRIRAQGRQHHLFDSFAGLSEPSKEDGSHWKRGDLSCSEAVVRRVLMEFDFVTFHRGWIPMRFEEVEGKRFAFVHLDVDLYEPTRDSLEFFYSRLSPGGIILCDDYGYRSCIGARRAFDSFFRNKPEPVIELSSGQAFIVKAFETKQLPPREPGTERQR